VLRAFDAWRPIKTESQDGGSNAQRRSEPAPDLFAGTTTIATLTCGRSR